MSKTTAISKSIPTVIGFIFLLLRAWLFILIAWLAWDCPFTPVSHWFCSRRQAAGQREEWAAAQPCSAVWKHPSMSQQLCQSSKKHLVQSQDAIKALQGSFVKFHHHRLHNSQNAHLEDSDLSFLVESKQRLEWSGEEFPTSWGYLNYQLFFILIRNFVSGPRKTVLQNWYVCSHKNFWLQWINIFWNTSAFYELFDCFLIRKKTFHNVCLWDVQISIFLLLSLFWLIPPICFYFVSEWKNKQSGAVLHLCITLSKASTWAHFHGPQWCFNQEIMMQQMG